MAVPYTTAELINNIKLDCSVPTSQLTYTEEDFVFIANKCMQSEVIPLIMSAREEYFVTHVDTASPADGVIEIPSAAAGNKLRSVCAVSQTSPLVLSNLPRIDLDVISGAGFSNYVSIAGFYIEGNNICLYPNTSIPTNTTIRLYYYKRTLTLADPDNFATVSSVDTGTNTIVVDTVPATFVADVTLNSISSLPPFDITNESTTIVSVSSPSIVLDSVDGISVGDVIALEGYSGIPQIPVEAMDYLSMLSAYKCLQGLGDLEGATEAKDKAKTLKDNLLIMISQRVDGSIKKIMQPDGGLRLWSGIGGRRGSWGGW